MRSILAQMEWKVPIHIPAALPPACLSTRSFISRAALFVKVTARIREGGTPSRSSRAIRVVITRVLPDPAPAKTITGPPGWATASCCLGFSCSKTGGAGVGAVDIFLHYATPRALYQVKKSDAVL